MEVVKHAQQNMTEEIERFEPAPNWLASILYAKGIGSENGFIKVKKIGSKYLIEGKYKHTRIPRFEIEVIEDWDLKTDRTVFYVKDNPEYKYFLEKLKSIYLKIKHDITRPKRFKKKIVDDIF